jgi:DNA polymerase-3 subunit epsilon
VIGRRFDQCTFAVVDVETTGIDAASNRMVEIAVVTCDWTGSVQDRFETLVRPDGELSGGRAEMLADAPTFAEVAGDVVRRLRDHVVAGHNVSFDLRFIESELARLGTHLPSQPYVCTRELATVLGCDVANRTLASLCVYFDVPFERWHTAAEDASATATVMARLLDRAARFGRVDLAAVDCRWNGFGAEWPELAASGRLLVRDVARWPPTGDQPGSRRATEPSFRRLGEGPESRSGTVVTDADGDWDVPEAAEPPALTANEVWWEGDFRGLEGLAQLQDIVVPAFKANDDPELLAALVGLADLLRRHGGRDAEVRATLEEAYLVGLRRRDWAGLRRLVHEWWSYLASLRDVDGLVALLVRVAAEPALGDPIEMLRAQMTKSKASEPLVADDLVRRAVAVLSEGDGPPALAWEALAVLVDSLDDGEESLAVMQTAFRSGCDALAILDRLSERLERAGRFEEAAEVCARGLGTAPAPEQLARLTALRQRHRRCQQRLAQAATLFG